MVMSEKIAPERSTTRSHFCFFTQSTWVESAKYTSFHWRWSTTLVKNNFFKPVCLLQNNRKSWAFVCAPFAVLCYPESTMNNRISSASRSTGQRRDRKSEQRTAVKLRTIGITRVANTYNATMHWSYRYPQPQRPFTYNVILMMAPSLWAVITLGLFYCPNHKLSTPQFIKTWLNLVQGWTPLDFIGGWN